jgi:hypothetical protein
LTVTDQERANSRALIIFAKKPAPGAAKTRLSPPLTPEAASELYACMMLDTLEMASTLSGLTPFIFFQSDSGAYEYFDALAPEILLLPQKGENLGERMQSAFQEIFGRGFTNIAIIGTDSPDLPAEYIFEAFSLLEYEHTDVVFGPAEDGGYYLLAMKRVWDELFTDLPWSSAKLLAASVEKAKDSCLGASFLPEWHDIDTEYDLNRQELRDEKSPATRTRAFLISRLQPDNQQL